MMVKARAKVDECCGNCEFFKEDPKTASLDDGRCYRNPPRPVLGREWRGVWPLVLKTEWCGCWKGK